MHAFTITKPLLKMHYSWLVSRKVENRGGVVLYHFGFDDQIGPAASATNTGNTRQSPDRQAHRPRLSPPQVRR